MRLLSLFAALTVAAPAAGHEFWISPADYTVAPGRAMQAELRVGEKFEGPGYAFIPNRIVRYEVWQDGAAFEVLGTVGDRPALNAAAPGEGLVTVVHQTTPSLLTYDGWDRFVSFTEHKDFAWAQARHLERGFTEERVVESYTRFAKSLIAVGDGAGQDIEAGLLTEIVALANPYTDDLDGALPVKVLFDGAPRPDVQVEVFQKAADGSVTVALYRTDGDGVARIDVAPGVEYLVDAVVMREIEPEDDGPMWESLWASLTFRMPEG